MTRNNKKEKTQATRKRKFYKPHQTRDFEAINSTSIEWRKKMFDFLTNKEKKDKSKSNIQKILTRETERAREKEILIGINPETFLGCEILKQSREIIGLREEVRELKKLTTELISRLDNKK